MMEKFHKTTSRAYILTTIPSEICLLLPLIKDVASMVRGAVVTHKDIRQNTFLSHNGLQLLVQIRLPIVGRQ